MEVLIPVVVIAVSVLVMRALGSWMLRINDVIDLQKQILLELKKINKNKGA